MVGELNKLMILTVYQYIVDKYFVSITGRHDWGNAAYLLVS